MTFSQVLNKPEYWFRPSQILRKIRFVAGGFNESDLIPVHLPWGHSILARPGDAIGRNLLTLGVHELAVSEALWRLADAGERCLDIGANIGYMSSLLASKVGSSGHISAFEPHPEVFRRLKTNLARCDGQSNVEPYQNAIGATDGGADLIEPADFDKNEGTALIASRPATGSSVSERRHRVTMRRLDSIFSKHNQFGVMKVDVEGRELDVFRGAEQLLSENRIRDIVWEDHNVFPSDAAQFLLGYGYRIYHLAKGISGPKIGNPFLARTFLAAPRETINYLATTQPARAQSRLTPQGWRCLKSAR